MEGGWRDRRGHQYHRQAQREQQALGGMEGGWVGGSMTVSGTEIQFQQQHALYQQQQQQHYYHYHHHHHHQQQQQQQQQQPECVHGREEECE